LKFYEKKLKKKERNSKTIPPFHTLGSVHVNSMTFTAPATSVASPSRLRRINRLFYFWSAASFHIWEVSRPNPIKRLWWRASRSCTHQVA